MAFQVLALAPQPIADYFKAPLVVIGVLLAGFLLYRFVVKGLWKWLFAADEAGAIRATKQLMLPFQLVTLFFALKLGRSLLTVKLVPVVDAWLHGLFAAAIAILVIETGRIAIVDLVLTTHKKVAVPSILRDLVVGLVYITTALVFASSVYKFDITPILTLSGLMSLVIGMALQDTLGNLFAGLAINLERPFRLGDWVSIDGSIGQVKEITWRATKFRTRYDELIIIPNNAIAKAKIINYQLPTPTHAQIVEVGVSYAVSPVEAIAAIRACLLETPGICKTPTLDPYVASFGDSAVNYEIKFWVDDFEHVPGILGDLRARLWYKFQQRDIAIPFPIRSVYMRDDSKANTIELERKLETLKAVDFLVALSEQERRELAESARVAHYQKGERVFNEQETGDSLFIITEGQVELFIGTGDNTRGLAILDEGMVFGEMALLTGEPRSASARTIAPCEMVVLTKRNLDLIFHHRPDVAFEISKIIGERKAKMDTAKARLQQELHSKVAQSGGEVVAEQASADIFNRIKAFFRLS